MNLKALGDLFYSRRVLRRMTIRELAGLAGVSIGAISRLEKGESARVSFDVLLKLGRVLDVEMSEVESICNENLDGEPTDFMPRGDRHE